MSSIINEKTKQKLRQFLNRNRDAELATVYLFFIESKFNLQPVLFAKEKKIFKDGKEVIERLEKEGALWHETEIKITFGHHSVNERTKRIYICPFCGKVFGDNTHPNPQDAIYEWVAKCPENHERVGGLKAKRFFVSEDPDVIKNYIPKQKPKGPLIKKVYSSALSGKLFNSKEAVIEDFKEHYLRPLTIGEVQNQNRFEIDADLLSFLQEQLQEGKVASFVEELAEDEEFLPYVEKWIEAE